MRMTHLAQSADLAPNTSLVIGMGLTPPVV